LEVVRRERKHLTRTIQPWMQQASSAQMAVHILPRRRRRWHLTRLSWPICHKWIFRVKAATSPHTPDTKRP
jgi:hypothetical protein